MPTKAELEIQVEELKAALQDERVATSRLRSARIKDLDTTCEVEECDNDAEYVLVTRTSETRLCGIHSDAAECLLRQVGWDG